MVAVALAYGSGRLSVDLPDDRTTVIEPTFVPAVADPLGAITEAIREPVGGGPRLRDRVRRGDRVAISVCDITRPQPRREMIQAIVDELDGVVGADAVTILIATGTHRANTDEELAAMLGSDVLAEMRVINHDARDPAMLRDCGLMGDSVPVALNRHWLDADVRITTGFVEPHFFAGFSGGPKMVAPGLAGLDTVLTLHDARRIADPRATWGICEGNPVHDDVRAIAAGTGVTFAIDVILNRDKQIAGAFAGDILPMHEAARTVARELAMQPVPRRFEVVVTTNSGYPLDQNLYQSVKGMSAAANVVEEGGLIICAAECRDGLPDHGRYAELLGEADSPADLMQSLLAAGHTRPDQWQVQVQARIQQWARVALKTDGLTAAQVSAAHLVPCDDIEVCVAEELAKRGPAAQVCVLPEGPQTIPYVAAEHQA